MKMLLIYSLLFCGIISCNTKSPNDKPSNSKDKFTIHGLCTEKDDRIVYLFIAKENNIVILDSVAGLDNKFLISGATTSPQKAFIQFKDQLHAFPFILTNEAVEIELNTADIKESTITNSTINKDLENLQDASAAIYQKIDYLFPQLQKARMENDFESLDKINNSINQIEQENLKSLYDFIQKNPEKELSGLLLNDLWENKEKDSVLLQKLSKKLAPEIQKNLNFSIH